MILVLKNPILEEQIAALVQTLGLLGLGNQVVRTQGNVVIAVLGDVQAMPNHVFSKLDGVEKVLRLQKQCPLSSSCSNVSIPLGNELVVTAGGAPLIMAGPCSVEGEAQILHLAGLVKAAGARVLRGGAFKPRTSPYEFRGLGREALEYLGQARKISGLPVVSEVMSAEQVEVALPFVDILQIGARNMYNYELLREVGRTRAPVLLKRAMSATVDELLQAAEYILLEGNERVILCERGIRTFETQTRNTLDLAAVPVLKNLTNLPVIVDPSHGTGRRDLIRAMSRAAIACGADGLLIEVHADPAQALSDGPQSITPETLAEIVSDAARLWAVLNQEETVISAPQPVSLGQR